MNLKLTIKVEDLIKLGFTKTTSQNIIRQAKASLVTKGLLLYDNKRLGTVPTSAVEEIIGIKLSKEEDNLIG